MAGTVGCVTAPGSADDSSGGLENPDFEDGLTGWTVGRDLPADPNTGGPVDSEAVVTDERAASGTRSLSLFLDGSQDDGTIWVQQPVTLDGGQRLSVATYSEQESFNTITKLAVYAGPDPRRALVETDFDTSLAIEDHAGWERVSYPVSPASEGLVAVGISVVWETPVTRLLDDVRLTG